jgi:hypothetical protein
LIGIAALLAFSFIADIIPGSTLGTKPAPSTSPRMPATASLPIQTLLAEGNF